MSHKVYDGKGRWRNKAVAFRMSPEEDEQLEIAVAMSGLTKQDYIIHRLQNRDVVVVGNPRVYKGLRIHMARILEHLQRLVAGDSVDSELLEVIRLMTITMNGMKENSDEKR